jgi:hypothetical protein
MFKLRQTWNEVFPPKKLFALDARVNAIDPAWPITASPPSSIHVNPKFLQVFIYIIYIYICKSPQLLVTKPATLFMVEC